MRIADVPKHPAYLVFHDAFDRGAMDVWPAASFAEAQAEAAKLQERIEACGHEEAGGYKAYEKLPRVRVFKFHAEPHKP